ncbi:MAG TPA: hypothetical protein PLQ13_00885 [Candidatus Krumholzibacteria bacterium]|nr:hypothetical protein [Candidatus Krumholzibacteria bacterium]
MPRIYPYDLVNGHVVAVVGDRRCLIDTGAPASFGRPASLEIAGRCHDLAESYLGATAEGLSAGVGGPIDTLVGTDILNRHDLGIDPATGTVAFSELPLPLPASTLPLRTVLGIPAVTAHVGGEPTGLIFDTGAKLSYLDPELTRDLPVTGTAQDFYPWFGAFTTPVFDADIHLAGEPITLRVGNLPLMLAMSLLLAGTAGILGSALLATHRVTYAPRRGLLGLERLEAAERRASAAD